MNNLMTVHTLGPQLIKLLGLPKNVTSFELRCAAGEIVTVKCEYHPEDAIGIDTVLAEYELVPRATPAAVEPHPAEVIGFDAWMRERNECAHQEMMAAARAAAQRSSFGEALTAATIAHLRSCGFQIASDLV